MASPADEKIGALYALAAFGFWGVVPVYFKAIQHVSPMDILLHRIIWSVPVTALLITLARDWHTLAKALRNPKVRSTLFLSAVLVAANWYFFIYAINTGRVLQASLGYFINPLVNVLLGMVFLGERLRRAHTIAVLLAAAGTLNLAVSYGVVPWLSLTLAFLFGFYGLLRKNVAIESVNGLFVETSLITPLALAYLVFLSLTGRGAFGAVDLRTDILLVLCGAVTAFPLVWFTNAARRLRYSTVGLFQYIAPSTQFLLAVFVYREPFTMAHLITFGLIWIGLAIFMADMLATQRKARTPHS